ncbi:MAG: hypothetical protein EBQ96_02965 [Proteobacteria bacterium]|nr:hypothetical protein [Pseudomonadota bacterium]
MRDIGATIPQPFAYDWMSEEDVVGVAARRGFGTIESISTRFSFATQDRDGWHKHDHVYIGHVSGAVPLSEIRIHFSGGPSLEAVLGHDPMQASDLALRLSNLAIAEGARLSELKDCIDTTYIDLSSIEDMRVRNKPGLQAPDTHDIVYRRHSDTDWRWQEPLRFMHAEKCRLALLKIASAAADQAGFASIESFCDLPLESVQETFGDYALYIKPSSLVAVIAGREHDHEQGGYKNGSCAVHVLYGQGRYLGLGFCDDFIKARFAMRQLSVLNPALRPIDRSKLVFVHPLRFKAANGLIDNSARTAAVNDNRSVYLHFKNHARSVAISYKTEDAAKAAMAFMNVAAAEARKPRLVDRSGANVVHLIGGRAPI